MNIRLGSPVLAEDGGAGVVERLILHPDTQELEGVVAAQGGILKRDVVIPVGLLLAADDSGVRVSGTVEAINDLEPFAQSQYTAPPEEWIPPTDLPSSVYLFPLSPLAVGAFAMPTQVLPAEEEVEDLQEGDVEINAHTQVLARDGVAGKLERVVTEGDSDRVTHLIIQRGSLSSREVLVPMEQVQQMDETGIVLALSEAELDELPEFTE